MKIFRVLKGVAVSAVLWTAVLVPISVLLALITPFIGAPPVPRVFWGAFLLNRVVSGAVNGAVFGVMLATISRRQSLAALSLSRVIALGAVGGAIIPLIAASITIRHLATSVYGHPAIPWLPLAITVAVNSGLGAAWAGASLKLARRAPELSGSSDGEPLALASDPAA